jgi:hypothetical protein
MKVFTKSILLILIFCPSILLGQEDWHDKYKLSTIDNAISASNSTMPQESNDCIKPCYNYYGLFDLKFKVEMKYLDSIMLTSQTRKTYIDSWIKTYQPNSNKNMFIHEILFSSGGKKYWIFVQEPTVSFYKEELKKNDGVYLYLMFIGTIVINKETEYIYVANDFQKITGSEFKSENEKK